MCDCEFAVISWRRSEEWMRNISLWLCINSVFTTAIIFKGPLLLSYRSALPQFLQCNRACVFRHYISISSAMFGFLICTEACAGSKMCGNRFTHHLCIEICLPFGYVVETQWNNKSVVNKECCFALKYETFAVWWARYHCKTLAGFVAAMEIGADVTLTNTRLFLAHRQRGRWLWALHSVPPPWKHGQAAGADKVYEEGAASPLQGLQKCRSGCRIECSHWHKDISLQTNVVKVLSPLKFSAV